MIEAQYYQKLGDSLRVRCLLCPHTCELEPGETGECMGRINDQGVLRSTIYNQAVSLSMDPIEKKPLFHFKPGSHILSIAANACNFHCKFCQNWQISQHNIQGSSLTPEELTETMIKKKSIGVAFTYTEPFVWFEYIMEAARLIKEAGGSVVLVSNGYVNAKPLNELLPYIDAINVDLKSMEDSFYEYYCGAHVKWVLQTIERIAQADHVLMEVTNLIIPTLNNQPDHLHRLTDYLAELDPNIPLHLSAYYPTYKMSIPATSAEDLEHAYRIASEKLKYVFVGNLSLKKGEDTTCPSCGTVCIKRFRYSIISNHLVNGNECPECHTRLNVVP